MKQVHSEICETGLLAVVLLIQGNGSRYRLLDIGNIIHSLHQKVFNVHQMAEKYNIICNHIL